MKPDMVQVNDLEQLRAAAPAACPSFDEWHHAKYGCSFESRINGWLYQNVVRELTRDMREYTTEMMRGLRP
jgi:hypothetical protein